MKVNRHLLATAMAFTLVSGSAVADTGTINFSGLITGTTCNVDISGSGANATVTLPTVSADSLNGATKTNGKTRFTLGLSGCTTGLTSAKAYFSGGNTVDNATGRLKNTDNTGADFVSLQLRDGSNDSVIVVGDASQHTTTTGYVDISSGNATLPYFVEYYAEGVATAGLVASQVTYNLIYK
ncbi:fimbrial protein [Entomohabitans teleogrylli]|uniref:fimbrial protein n=1 Tax=Entomohabitans teleogrylli TaxID=1384589 RepID=UPI00073D9409|nr:fimbrial protein [Entomohabitans teleogrylli]